MKVVTKGQHSPMAKAISWLRVNSFSGLLVKPMTRDPAPSPSNNPAPLDCSDRTVRAVKVAAANDHAVPGDSSNRTAQYKARQAQRVLSQLCMTRNRHGIAVTVITPVTNKLACRPHTLRASKYVIGENTAPKVARAVCATA